MTWQDKLYSQDINDPVLMAEFVIEALTAILGCPVDATLTNMMMNDLRPSTIAMCLDGGGIPCKR